MKKTNKQYNKHNSAFTIVELLIVIVVIAILAAITVVAYNGIQTRAYNVAVISQAKQTVDLINAYVAVEGKYPETVSNSYCATRDNECIDWNSGNPATTSNTNLIANLSTIGTPVASRLAGDAGGRYGIIYNYWIGTGSNTRAWYGITQPVAIRYDLKGINQQCNLPNVMNGTQNGPTTNGYSWNNVGSTTCVIHIEGPTS